jgi:single-strand DNA-binding protein
MEGNLVADGEVRHFGEKGVELGFTIANNSGYGDYEKTTFMKCKLYGKRGEAVAPYVKKGGRVTVQGSVLIDQYEKDGEKKYITYIKVQELSLGPKRESSSAPSGNKDDDIPF